MGESIRPRDETQERLVVKLDRRMQTIERLGTGKNAIGARNVGILPRCRVTKTAVQSIPDNIAAGTAIAFDSEASGSGCYDTDQIHDTVTLNTRLTCKTAGAYLPVGNVDWAVNVAGIRGIWVQKNGGTLLFGAHIVQATVGGVYGTAIGTHSQVVELVVGDYLELMVLQNSGAALNVNASVFSPFFGMAWVGR